jgi:hypothetical protein
VSLLADSRLDGDIRARNAQVGGMAMGDIVGTGCRAGLRAWVEAISTPVCPVAEGAVFIGTSVMGDEGRHEDGSRKG